MVSTTSLLGAAGEHYVVSELLRRDFIAALAPQGVPNLDIVVTDIVGEQLCAIQVKSRLDKGSDGGWHMGPKHETLISDNLFYVFVDFGKTTNDNAEVFVLPSAKVAEVVSVSHQIWLSNPGKNGIVRKDSKVRRLLPDYSNSFRPTPCPYSLGWLEPYRQAWHLLTQNSDEAQKPEVAPVGVGPPDAQKTSKICPECGHVFKGNGWDGIDAHWRSKHRDVMSYEEAWPLIKRGVYHR